MNCATWCVVRVACEVVRGERTRRRPRIQRCALPITNTHPATRTTRLNAGFVAQQSPSGSDSLRLPGRWCGSQGWPAVRPDSGARWCAMARSKLSGAMAYVLVRSATARFWRNSWRRSRILRSSWGETASAASRIWPAGCLAGGRSLHHVRPQRTAIALHPRPAVGSASPSPAGQRRNAGGAAHQCRAMSPALSSVVGRVSAMRSMSSLLMTT